jgi:hypothetical protein
MKALAAFPAALLLALAAGTPAVAAPADDPEQIVEDCSDSDLPPEVVDYCLRRVHRLNETNPTADSTALEAQLQRRADGLHRNNESDSPPGDRNDDQNSGMDRRDDDQGYDDKGYDDQGYDDRGYDNRQPQDQPGADDDDDRPPQKDEDSRDDTSGDQPPQRPNGY